MAEEPKTLKTEQILSEISRLFMAPAHDRQVYCVFGSYERMRKFQKRILEETNRGGFDTSRGKVQYLSINQEIFDHLKLLGKYEQAAKLADRRRDAQLKTILSDTFRDLVTRRIEAVGTAGLFLADLEFLYAYDLGEHDVSLARQVAINGKRICFLIPGVWRDGRLWIFDEDSEARRIFPDALLFTSPGWVFQIADA